MEVGDQAQYEDNGAELCGAFPLIFATESFLHLFQLLFRAHGVFAKFIHLVSKHDHRNRQKEQHDAEADETVITCVFFALIARPSVKKPVFHAFAAAETCMSRFALVASDAPFRRVAQQTRGRPFFSIPLARWALFAFSISSKVIATVPAWRAILALFVRRHKFFARWARLARSSQPG